MRRATRKHTVNYLALALTGLMISSSALASTPVNVNTADAPTLAQSLDGVGLAKAQAIVAWREANGRFESADQLTEVKGIGQALVDRNREAIQVDGGKPDKKPRASRAGRAKGADTDD
jgi:competence protein ComEA